MKPEWVRSILQQAEEQGVAFFFKQWGTWGSDGIKRNKKANGKVFDGQIIQMMPQLAMR
jgi:protein gp37